MFVKKSVRVIGMLAVLLLEGIGVIVCWQRACLLLVDPSYAIIVACFAVLKNVCGILFHFSLHEGNRKGAIVPLACWFLLLVGTGWTTVSAVSTAILDTLEHRKEASDVNNKITKSTLDQIDNESATEKAASEAARSKPNSMGAMGNLDHSARRLNDLRGEARKDIERKDRVLVADGLGEMLGWMGVPARVGQIWGIAAFAVVTEIISIFGGWLFLPPVPTLIPVEVMPAPRDRRRDEQPKRKAIAAPRKPRERDVHPTVQAFATTLDGADAYIGIDLYGRYAASCINQGLTPVSNKDFVHGLMACGFVRVKQNGRAHYCREV